MTKPASILAFFIREPTCGATTLLVFRLVALMG